MRGYISVLEEVIGHTFGRQDYGMNPHMIQLEIHENISQKSCRISLVRLEFVFHEGFFQKKTINPKTRRSQSASI
jgi:hypothetical protein